MLLTLKKQRKLKQKIPRDLRFLFTVGIVFAWSLAAGVHTTTVFAQNYAHSFLKMVAIVPLLAFLLGTKKRVKATAFLAVCLIAFAASGFLATGEGATLGNPLADVLRRTFEFAIGVRTHSDVYERIIRWLISGGMGLIVVIFAYLKFNFVFLLAASAIVFALSAMNPYFEETTAFYALFFCVMATLLKSLHLRNGFKIGGAHRETGKLIATVLAASFAVGRLLPMPEAGFLGSRIQSGWQNPFDFFTDLFATVPLRGEFSLQSIGFGESGGLLGGDISVNNGVFMRVQTNRSQFYLTGRVMDTYTGNSWANSFDEPVSVDFGSLEQNLEMFELMNFNHNFHAFELMESLQRGTFAPVEDVAMRVFGAPFAQLGWNDEEISSWEQVRLFEDPSTGMLTWATAENGADGILGGTWHMNSADFFQWESNVMVVDVLNSRTQSLFHTGVVHGAMLHDEEAYLLRSGDRNFSTEEQLPPNSRYGFTYAPLAATWMRDEMLPLSREGIFGEVVAAIDAFSQAHGYYLSQLSGVEHEGRKIQFVELLESYLIPRAELIHERYTALPEELPQRVRDLAYEVTASGENNYERMRLLETFIATSFPYTLSPGPSPRDQDFVDHFLFELQRGYCVHFGTAFVVMARALGMPTRYVEGFLVTGRPGAGSDGFIDVLNNMAHAWPEVYFEGVGWQRFEPTPSGGLPFNYFANQESDTDAEPAMPELPLDMPTGSENTWGEEYIPDNYLEMAQNPATAAPDDAAAPSAPVEEIASESERPGLRIWPWLILGILSMAAAATFLALQSKKKGLAKTGRNEEAIRAFHLILSYLKCFNYGIQGGETVQQFIHRVDGHYPYLLSAAEREWLLKSLEIYTKAKYSPGTVSMEELKTTVKTAQLLKSRMKKEFGKGKYAYCRGKLALAKGSYWRKTAK